MENTVLTAQLWCGCGEEATKSCPHPSGKKKKEKREKLSLKTWYGESQVIRAAGVSSANFLRLMFI